MEAIRHRRRTDEEYGEQEGLANAEAMRYRRDTDEQYRENERFAHTEAMRSRRNTDEEYRENKRLANAQAMRYRRDTDEEYRENERLANAEAMQNRRTDKETWNEEHARDREARQRLRSSYAAALVTHNIDISDNWLTRYDRNEPRLADSNIETEEDEEDTDDAEPLNPGVQETMLLEEESQQGIRMAPEEAQRPISILLDEDTEYLSFPTIFGVKNCIPYFAVAQCHIQILPNLLQCDTTAE
ncbi:unnamed protein product [Gongylonema pulchrum]|uniref:Trichohyalin-like n=1 Tax=Gongylonema pulchrum TaxID=637853 RepID=A0A183CUK3_9BILA|nr:unnamed protein product [Gongylonema pulchrum]